MDPEKIKRQLKETYNKIAPDFAETRKAAWPQVRQFVEQLPKGSAILDLGGGAGRHSLLAQEYGHKVICFDHSLGQLKQAKKIGVSQCALGDMTKLPSEDKSFDAVLYIAALHHLPTEEERLQSLKECKRVLKAGGRMLVSVWSRHQQRFAGKVDGKGDLFHTWRKKYPRYYHLFMEEELKRLAEQADLSVERIWISGDNIWTISQKKC